MIKLIYICLKIGKKMVKTRSSFSKEKILIKSVLLLGKKLIESGSELKRAEDTMNRIINNSPSLTPSETHETFVYVTINSIFIRSNQQVIDFIIIGERTFDLNKVKELNQLSRDYADNKISVYQLFSNIKIISKYKTKIKYEWFWYGLLSLSITLILGGSWLECLIAAVVGIITSQIYKTNKQIFKNKFLYELLSVIPGGAIGWASGIILHHDPTLMYISAIIPLVPGINLTNGVHDTFDNYYISGPVMMLESLTTLISLSLGITIFQALPFGITPTGLMNIYGVPLPSAIFGSAVCAIAFSRMIHVSKSLVLPIGFSGIMTWMTYIHVGNIWSGPLFAILISVCMLTVISRILAKVYRVPMTLFFIPSIVLIVPGVTMFLGITQWALGDTSESLHTLSNVFINLLGLSIGSILGEEIYRGINLFYNIKIH